MYRDRILYTWINPLTWNDKINIIKLGNISEIFL